MFSAWEISFTVKPKEGTPGGQVVSFSQIKVDIEIEALIERPGLVGEPLKIR